MIKLIAAFILLLPSPLIHDIHVSQCDIKEKIDGSLELTFKIFFDDLQKSMGMTSGEELSASYKGADYLINSFLEKSITILIDDKKYTWKYIKSYNSNPAVWTTVIIEPYKGWKKLQIKNTIMNDLFSDQINMVHFKFSEKTESVNLNSKQTSASYIR